MALAVTPRRSLAEHFGVRVIALDPSAQMLAQAQPKTTGRVAYVRARGEALPLARTSLSMIFISMVFHHFDDPGSALDEYHRVLRPGGPLPARWDCRVFRST
ncbi:MAG: class I SAM-dependent methyltransferase [Candidatus Binataceae bacterium]